MFSFRRGDRSAGSVKRAPTCTHLDSLPLVDTEKVPAKKPRNDKGNNNNNNSSNLQSLFRFLTLGKSDQKGNRRRKRRRNNRKGSQGGVLVGSTNSTVHMSGVRKSTSTHFTRSTNGGHSSAFMVYDPLVEPMTMEDFLRCEELAAFEQQQETGNAYDQTLPTETIEQEDGAGDFVGAAVHGDCQQQECTCSEDVASECTSGKPLHHHRVPPPESYYEMTKNEHAELGNIQFEFDALEQAQEESMQRVQPILCIEAEVPGDITSGETIFSHPLIVEAAESLFVTVRPRPLEPQDDEEDQDDSHGAIDQSASSFASLHSATARSTKRKRLGDKRYFTNSSCRTRVRILDDKGIDVLPPTEHMTAVEVVTAMVRGLEAYHQHNSNSIIPKYLRLLLEEEAGKLQVLSKTRLREIQGTAFFGVFDSVTAEVELAALDGILSTRSGALVRQKVVQVTYDSRKLSYCALVRHALCRAGATIIYHQSNEERVVAKLEVQQFEESRAMKLKLYGNAKVCNTDDRDNEEKNEEGDEDNEMESVPLPAIKLTDYFGTMRAACNPKPALRGSVLRFVPLTDLQATKANRLIHLQKFNEAMHLLSPRQGLIAMQALQAHRSRDFQDVVDVPIGCAWSQLCADAAAISEIHQRAMIAGRVRCCDDDDASYSPTEDPTEEYEDPYLQ